MEDAATAAQKKTSRDLPLSPRIKSRDVGRLAHKLAPHREQHVDVPKKPVVSEELPAERHGENLERRAHYLADSDSAVPTATDISTRRRCLKSYRWPAFTTSNSSPVAESSGWWPKTET